MSFVGKAIGSIFGGGSKTTTTVTTPQNTTVNPTTQVFTTNEAIDLTPIQRVVEAITTQDLHQYEILAKVVEATAQANKEEKESDKKMFMLAMLGVGFVGIAIARK